MFFNKVGTPTRLLKVLGLVSLAVLLLAGPPQSILPVSDLFRPGPAERLLVVAPHPDDETLCCAGVIRRAREAGAQVAVVWLTSGDAFNLDAELVQRTLRHTPRNLRALAVMRMQEAHAAADVLGVPAEGQFFLCYPDQGLGPLLGAYRNMPFTSPHTRASAVWCNGALSPGAAYEGRNLQRDLEAVIDRFQPTHVLAPSPLDTHPDHHAAGELVMRVLAGRSATGKLRQWIVHGGFGWPAPRGLHADRMLAPPEQAAGVDWEAVPLTSQERDRKLHAVQSYASQMAISSRFMLAFVRSNELFARPPSSATAAAR